MDTNTRGNRFLGNHGVRYSNFELLRILAMLMIIASHFSFHGHFQFPENRISFNQILIHCFQIGGNLGVDIFVLISSFFMIHSKECKTEKLLRLWLQVLFYSVTLYAVFVLTGIESFSFQGLISSCFPLLFKKWWFAGSYFMFYLLSPYITRLLKVLDRKTYQRFLLVMLVFWCLIPTFTGQWFESNNLCWFVCLYACMGYYRLHGPKNQVKAATCIWLATSGILLIVLSIVLFDFIGLWVPLFAAHPTFFVGMNKVPNLFIAMMLVIGFSKMDFGYRHGINVVSSAVFGVYLIHENEYVRAFLWQTLFRNATYSDSPWLLFYALLVVMIVFVVCVAIELLRIYILERPCLGILRRVADGIDRFQESILEKF